MKIAIAFFGLPRCSRITVPSIEDNILKQLPPQSEVKCFYHFYQQNEVVNSHSNESGSLDQSNYDFFESFNGLLERPEDVLPRLDFEEFKKFGNAWGTEDFSSLKNLLLQLNSLKRVTELVESFEPDCVLFARPDLCYHDPISPKYYKLASKFKDAVILPEWQWGVGVNDRFAITGKNAFRSYGKRLDEAMNYCSDGNKPLHSERLLKYALLKNQKEIFILDAKASRVRINGEFADEKKFVTNISLFSPLTNPQKRFLFLTQLKTKWTLTSLKIFA